jgi:hypothetical protein
MPDGIAALVHHANDVVLFVVDQEEDEVMSAPYPA